MHNSIPIKEPLAPPEADSYQILEEDRIFISPYHGENELEANKRVALFLSKKLNKKIYLLPRIGVDTEEQRALRNKLMPKGVIPNKNPDFMIGGNLFESKSMLGVKPTTNENIIKNAIQNRIKDAKKQANNIILEIPSHITRKQINRYIISYLKQSKTKRIIIVKWKNKSIIFSNGA